MTKEDKILENQILDKAHQVFMAEGVKSSTMDVVCKKIGISKKTLYKYVDNKKDLILKILQKNHDTDVVFFDDLVSRKLNAIDHLYAISQMIIDKLEEMNPSILSEFEEYYPEAIQFINDKINSTIYSNILSNIQAGIQQGYYRDNIKADIIARSYVVLTNNMFCNVKSEQTISIHGLKTVYIEVFRYHIRGISNEKGRAYLKEKVQKEKLKH